MREFWKGKTVLVCGASAGLGQHLASALAGQKARVILCARNSERLITVQQELAALHPAAQIHALSADLVDAASGKKLAATIQQQFQRLDMVINAIGESDRGSISDLTCERMIELFRRNVCSSLVVTQNFSPLLRTTDKRQTGGVLVLIGSLSSHFAPRFLGGYSITKHGVAALAQQARLELAEEKIHVMLASPGPIARPDAGTRYSDRAMQLNVPKEAMLSGGGAKIKGLDPQKLSEHILSAAARRKCTLILPRKARLLLILGSLSPRIGDYLLRRKTS
jgi:uncharacterized protein